MKSLLYRLTDLAAWHCGLGKWVARDSIAIFMMHGVHDQPMTARFPAPYNSLALEDFAESIRILRQRYEIIPLDQAVDMLAGRVAWRPRCVVLTFDDSLKCLLPTAAAFLSSRGLNATFYLSTEVIENRRAYWWKRIEYTVSRARQPQAAVTLPNGQTFNIQSSQGLASLAVLKRLLKTLSPADIEQAIASLEQQFDARLELSDDADPYANILSWAEVRQMISLGMTIGSHSVSHSNLTLLSPPALDVEMTTSRQIIYERTGLECRHFCYPYGEHSDAVCLAAKKAGYISAVTTVAPGFNARGDDVLRLRRFSLPSAPYKLGVVLAGLGGRD